MMGFKKNSFLLARLFATLALLLLGQQGRTQSAGELYKGGLDTLTKNVFRNIYSTVKHRPSTHLLFYEIKLDRKGFKSVRQIYAKPDSVSLQVIAAIEKTGSGWMGNRRRSQRIILPIFLLPDEEERLRVDSGKLNGWLGYTLSRTERQFDDISPNYFPAKQDRTHDLSLVSIYKLSSRWTFSGTFVYSTGNAVTFPSGKYQLEGQTNYYYTERNGYRMPDYHRFDIAATLDGKAGRKFKSSWTFGAYNAYNRHNAYVVEFKDDPADNSRTQTVQTALFGIIPSITWNFKF